MTRNVYLVICDLHFTESGCITLYLLDPCLATDTYTHLFGVFSSFITYVRMQSTYATVIPSCNSYLKEILRELTKIASITYVIGKIYGSISRSNVLMGFSGAVFMRGNALSLPSWRTRVCVLSIGERRPLSLLIKPNRNRKAESKLHNYTGLRLSLTPTYMAFTSPPLSLSLSGFLPTFFDTLFYLAAFFRALKSFLFSSKIERIMMLQIDQHAC